MLATNAKMSHISEGKGINRKLVLRKHAPKPLTTTTINHTETATEIEPDEMIHESRLCCCTLTFKVLTHFM